MYRKIKSKHILLRRTRIVSNTGKGCGPGCVVMLVAFILGGFAFFKVSPILPHIQLPAEKLSAQPIFGDIYLTNTEVSMIIVDIVVILMAIAASRAIKKAMKDGYMVPTGITGAIEALLEAIHNLTESTAGKWTPRIFPWFAAITLFVLIANWMELIPGVDSIGNLQAAKVEEGEHGYPVKQLAPGIFYIYDSREEHKAEVQSGDLAGGEGLFVVVPYVRALATDLNFTVGLALIAVIMVQVYGVMAHGGRYFLKFFAFDKVIPPSKIAKNPLGVIDLGVGFLELISEFSKILSFSFRLFGNIFAGSVLLFVIGTLVSVVAQWAFLGLEFFVGLIQAFVFGMLTMVFMSQAVAGHGGHAEEEGAH
jgi:F-type H+-transporting ATPase subunit a